MPDDNNKKAVDINVESLKLYITLSTVSIAGLLTFYSKLIGPTYTALFYSAIILFLLCSILSILIVNHFIIQANNGAYDVRTLWSRIPNFIAIFFFLAAVVSGSIFITNNSVKEEKHIVPNQSGVVIENNKIIIGSDFKNKVLIESDTLKNINRIYVNYDNK